MAISTALPCPLASPSAAARQTWALFSILLGDGGDDDVGRLSFEEALHVADGAEEAVADHLGRLPGVVRGEDDVGERENRIVGGERLLVEDVEASALDAVLAKRGEEGV